MLNAPVNCFAEVRLNIHGASRVSWDERRAYTKGSAPVISHKNSEIFLDHTISLLKKGESRAHMWRSEMGWVDQPPPFDPRLLAWI